MSVKFRWVFTILILVLCTMMCSGCTKTVEGLDESMVEVEELRVPNNTAIAALGEASHGNKEFQELKLSVFRTLVENQGFQTFALEGDFGGCAVVNDYIHGGEGTALEAVSAIGFQIYRTEEMAALAEWMRSYNQGASPEEQLSFFGFDMQRVDQSAPRLAAYLEALNTEETAALASSLTELFGEQEDPTAAAVVADRNKVLEEIKKDLAANGEEYINQLGETEYAYALHYADCLSQCVTLSTASGGDYNTLRDEFMAKNVQWLLDTEELNLTEGLMLSGHNGHVAKKGSSYKNMGSLLSEVYGSSYFVIGTDFYKTDCNLPQGDKRKVHSFCSKDPLAAGLKDKKGMYYLDFSEIEEDSALGQIIQAPMKMGSLGESYGWYMKLLSKTYTIKMVPAELYDGMILTYQATPTVIIEKTAD